MGVCITLLHELDAIGVEDGDPVHFWVEHLEADEFPDLDVVAHGKRCPPVVNRRMSTMVVGRDQPVAASVRLEDDLFRDGSKMMAEC